MRDDDLKGIFGVDLAPATGAPGGHAATGAARAVGGDGAPMGDTFNLSRFVEAQETTYPAAIRELRQGRKRGHWMWFVFPQFDGLGSSAMSRRYAIKSLAEAETYLKHPVLGPRLHECAEALLLFTGLSVSDIFPYPDDLKLKSSMTLFELVSPPGSVFARILDEYFRGERDGLTLRLARREADGVPSDDSAPGSGV